MQLGREVARIEQRLDEREREERYRLKRVKARTRRDKNAPSAPASGEA